MLTNILPYFILIILSVRLIRGSPISDEQRSRQKISEEMLKFMNTSIDPCENFYEFACGNYEQYYVDEAVQQGMWSPMFSHWKAKENKKGTELIALNENGTVADKKVKQFYDSCIAKPELPAAYRDKFKQLIGEFGKMPLLEGEHWQESNFDWVKTVAEINYKTDFGVIVDVNIVPDFADNTLNRVSLIQADFNFPDKIMYSDAKFENTRTVFTSNIAFYLSEFLGVEKESAKQAAGEMFEVERALAQGMQKLDVLSPEELYDVISIDEMQEKYLPAWDSRKLLSTALDLYPARVMIQTQYLKVAFDVIQKTPKRIVANYIFYTYLYEYIKTIPVPVTPKKSESCLQVTSVYFGEYLENLVYRKYYKQHDKAGLNFMWQQLRTAFEDVLMSSRINWIHHDVRHEAVEKLKSMRMIIGSYEDIDFVHRYAQLNMNSYDFIGNIYEILKLRGSAARARIIKPPTFKVPPSVSPVYSSEENIVYIPLGYLLPETLGPSSLHPYAQQFGDMGFILGHEMSHGFDDVGRLYDRKGNRRTWWDKESFQEYDQRIECIAGQYRNYTFRGIPLPELERQAENIADNVGLRVAYTAYQKWYNSASKRHRDMEVLPGFKYNHKKFFFVSFAQVMCSAKPPTYAYDGDTHVPENVRLIGALSNFEDFSKVFGCPKGAAMNPIKKCEIF